MKTTNRSLLFVIALSISTVANAAGSMLRIACGDNFNDAEIVVNGKFKGQCPIDVQVPEGNVQLEFRKKTGDSTQQVFTTEFRIGDGVIRKVEVPGVKAKWRFTPTNEILQKEGKSFAADQKAAKAGDTQAMIHLGYLYQFGAGVPRDINQAISWYTRAAEAGNANAMLSLGLMYQDDREVPRNIEASYFWFRKAKAAGNELADGFLESLARTEKMEAAKE